MRTTHLFFVITLLLIGYSCSNKKSIEIINPENISLVIGNPVSYGLDSVLLFPVGGNYNPKINEAAKKVAITDQYADYNAETTGFGFSENSADNRYDRLASSEYYNERENEFDIRNILFYNKLSGTTYPLIKDTMHILSFSIHNEYKRPLIFYRIVKKDINGDKKFNSKDAVMLFISNNDGMNLVQVTPDNEQFFDYFYYSETNSILVKTAIDIDADKIFTTADETNFREVKLDIPAYGREIFSKGMKDSLKVWMK
ncbi:MAG: hypothetical protein ACHQFW_08875 [Chitinophagales bacterium]